jgi:signal transduction histidine kinase
VSFEFASLNFTNPEKNRFAYKMEGFDESWTDAGTRRFARYTNLPAGDFVFRLRGSNDDDLWNEAGLALAVTVQPPFWTTWWFRGLGLAAIIVMLASLYRYRMARAIEMERMRLRIAGDLHDDIGANLSSIALLSDMVQGRDQLGERERRQLSRISSSARSMVESLRDIVWSIDPESDQPGRLEERMRDTAASMLGDVIRRRSTCASAGMCFSSTKRFCTISFGIRTRRASPSNCSTNASWSF